MTLNWKPVNLSRQATHRVAAMAIGIMGPVLVVAFMLLPATRDIYESFELKCLDLRFVTRPPLPDSVGTRDRIKITHVDIDDQSIIDVGRWPWPREKHAQIIDVLTELGAWGIVFDVEFPHPAQRLVEDLRYENNIEQVRKLFENIASAQYSEHIYTPFLAVAKDDTLTLNEKAEKLRELMFRMDSELKQDVGRQEEEALAEIREFILDHDAILARSIARSGRVYIPFHFDFSRRLVNEMATRGTEIREIITADPAIDEAEFADRMGVPPARIKGLFSSVKKRVFLDQPELQAKADEILAGDRTLSVDAASLAKSLGVPAGVVEENITEMRKDAISRHIARIMAARPDATLPDILAEMKPEPEALVRIVRETFDRTRSILTTTTRFSMPAKIAAGDTLLKGDTLVPAISSFTAGTSTSGYVTILPDETDGVLRRVPLVVMYEGKAYPQIAFRAAVRFLQVPEDQVEIVPGSYVKLPGARLGDAAPRDLYLPIDDKGQLLINWAGPWRSDIQNVFNHVKTSTIVQIATERHAVDTYYVALAQLVAANASIAGAESMARAAPDLAPLLAAKTPYREIRTAMAGKDAQLAAAGSLIVAATTQRLASGKFPPAVAAGLRARSDSIDRVMKEIEIRKQLVEEKIKGNREAVAGSICVIGDIHTGSTDMKPTPMNPVYPGVGLHTHLINTIFQGRFLHRVTPGVNLILVLLVGAVITILVTFAKPVAAVAFAIGGTITFFVVALLLFAYGGLWIDVAGPVVATFTAFAGVTVFRHQTEEKQKKEIKNAFSHYMSEHVIEDLIQNPDKLKLGGERRIMTVHFSDLAGFTSISENLEPEELVALLNEYLTDMTDIIMEHGGTLDKYIGDALMAFWGAPLEQPDHAIRACMATLACQERLQGLRKRLLDEGKPDIFARVGLNTGPMVVGNMGSQKRFNYTVMGDTVNLGSRLEGANKPFGTAVMISESTYDLAQSAIEVRELDLLRVKGKRQPIRVYELMGRKGQLSEVKTRVREAYDRGLGLYRAREWDKAIATLKTALELDPNDGPSKTYIERAEHFIEEPPAADWDGVYVMKTK